MRLPKRPDKHIAESKSMTIFRYHMPAEWIIREMTERDYGIDLYVELVGRGNKLSGELVALQLKATKKMKLKKGHHTARGIKRATLNYWLSLPVSVFLVVTCLDTKTLLWANIRELNREGRFAGESQSVSVPLRGEADFSKPGIAAFWFCYLRERRWPEIESAIEKSLMLFNSLGPLILMCLRNRDESVCTTTVQYLINQHYEYYALMYRYLAGGRPRPLPEWYFENVEYVKSAGLEPSVTLYYYTLRKMIKAFVSQYRDAILVAYELVTDRQSAYFSTRFPFLTMHLEERPHTFIADDWFPRFFYDEFERDTSNPELLYFADFTEFDGALPDLLRT